MNQNNVYRINDNPCTQQTIRCDYPFTTDKSITSYLCCKNHLIELLSYIVQVLDENDIIYFLDYGTLLGCVRNNSFIPWDKDVDIGVIDCNNLDEVMDKLKNNDKGYYFKKETDDFFRLNFSEKNTLHVDITIRKKDQNNNYYDRYFDYNWIIHEDDLFPLKITTFENITVKIPNNSKKYLENDDLYGKDCITTPKTRGNNEPWERW